MLIFRYDKTFEGLLTAIFDAYSIKRFPDVLLAAEETSPLFYDEIITVVTDEERSNRVWKGLQKKLSASALTSLTTCWLSELPEIDLVLFRYIHKAIDAPRSIELNFGDPDVLELSKVWKKVNNERLRVMQFLRFQKAADGTYFAAATPEHDALPLSLDYFTDRFADQRWLIYDRRRDYGYYYDGRTARRVTLEDDRGMIADKLADRWLAEDERQFQLLWKNYFRALAIPQRINERQQRRMMPRRYWKHLTEME